MKESIDISQNGFWNDFILDGNLNALSNIYQQYYDLLFDYGRKHTPDKQLVEDTIQNVFINLIKFRRKIGSVNNLSGYLICTFRRQLYLDLNNQKKTILTEQLPEEDFDYYKNPEQDISDNENLDQLHATIRLCIGNLTSKQQEIIYLRFEREISYEEIAGILNISVDSCYKSVHRCIKTIRSEAEKIIRNKVPILFWFMFRSKH